MRTVSLSTGESATRFAPRYQTPFGNALRRASGHAHGGGVSVAEPELARPPTGAAANRRASPPTGKPARPHPATLRAVEKPAAPREGQRPASSQLGATPQEHHHHTGKR